MNSRANIESVKNNECEYKKNRRKEKYNGERGRKGER